MAIHSLRAMLYYTPSNKILGECWADFGPGPSPLQISREAMSITESTVINNSRLTKYQPSPLSLPSAVKFHPVTAACRVRVRCIRRANYQLACYYAFIPMKPATNITLQEDDDTPDEWDQRILKTGCYEENLALQLCHADEGDWRKCLGQMAAFRKCWEANKNNERTHTVDEK